MSGGSVSRRSPGCWALVPRRLARAPAGEWQTCEWRLTVYKGLVHDGSFTEATGSTDAGDRPGSQTRQTIAATAPPGVANGPSRSPGFVRNSAGYRPPSGLRNIRTAFDMGPLRRAVRVGHRARLDR